MARSMFRAKTTGGNKAIRYARKRREILAMLEGLDLRVGFPDGYIMPLAITLEYGVRDSSSGRSKLPPRPAYRVARPAMRKAWRRRCKRIMREASRPGASRSSVLPLVRSAVREQREILQRSYETFHGAPLSERQRARKAGTPYESRQLVGGEGPKLIGHISAWVDGVEV